MTFIRELIIAFWLIFLIYWTVTAASAKKTMNASQWWRGWALRMFLIIVVVLAFHTQLTQWSATLQTMEETNPLVDGIGGFLCGAGIAFAIWARYHLGRNWGMPMTRKKEPELVTSGPYAYVRHPIYTGVLTAILGSALVSGAWWLVIFLTASVYFIYSATMEEKYLMQIFPTQYPPYKKKTKMLIPFVF